MIAEARGRETRSGCAPRRGRRPLNAAVPRAVEQGSRATREPRMQLPVAIRCDGPALLRLPRIGSYMIRS